MKYHKKMKKKRYFIINVITYLILLKMNYEIFNNLTEEQIQEVNKMMRQMVIKNIEKRKSEKIRQFAEALLERDNKKHDKSRTRFWL